MNSATTAAGSSGAVTRQSYVTTEMIDPVPGAVTDTIR
jgi:hypothetical protein